MKKFNKYLLMLLLLPLASCSSISRLSASGQKAEILEQKELEIQNLQSQVAAQQTALEEKNATIAEQHEIIENQHARIQDMINALYDTDNDYEYVDAEILSSLASDEMQELAYVGLGPYTVENTSGVYSFNTGTTADNLYRYSDGAGQSKASVSQSDGVTESAEQIVAYSGKKVSMNPIAAYPQISSLSGQAREWAQKIYDAIISGQTTVDVDPNYFGVSTGTLNSPQAIEIERAVYFTLYPQNSYFNNGMLFSKGHLSMDGTGNYTGFTLYLKDFKSSYLSIIDDWMNRMLAGIDSSTTEAEAYQIIHDRVDQYLTYTPAALHNSLTTVIATGQGVCNDYAEMVVSLCRKIGIDARYVTGYYNGNYHAWVQVNIDGTWYYSDPTNDDQSYGIIRNFYLSPQLFDGYSIASVN